MERLTSRVVLRLSSSDDDRLRALAARVPAARRAALAREVLRYGLEVAERRPEVLLRPSAKRRA